MGDGDTTPCQVNIYRHNGWQYNKFRHRLSKMLLVTAYYYYQMCPRIYSNVLFQYTSVSSSSGIWCKRDIHLRRARHWLYISTIWRWWTTVGITILIPGVFFRLTINLLTPKFPFYVWALILLKGTVGIWIITWSRWLADTMDVSHVFCFSVSVQRYIRVISWCPFQICIVFH